MTKIFKIGDKVIRTTSYGGNKGFMKKGGVYEVYSFLKIFATNWIRLKDDPDVFNEYHADNFDPFVEIPQVDFKNMKFRVEDREHSIVIQDALFSLGYSWSIGEKDDDNKRYLDATFLYANEDGSIGYGNTKHFFERESGEYQEHTVVIIPTYKLEPVVAEVPRECVEFNGAFYDKEEFEKSISHLKPVAN